jgi:hypothetical protein
VHEPPAFKAVTGPALEPRAARLSYRTFGFGSAGGGSQLSAAPSTEAGWRANPFQNLNCRAFAHSGFPCDLQRKTPGERLRFPKCDGLRTRRDGLVNNRDENRGQSVT